MSASRIAQFGRFVMHRLLVITGAIGLTFAFFLVLPLMQTISKPLNADTIVQTIETADVPPPPLRPRRKRKRSRSLKSSRPNCWRKRRRSISRSLNWP